MNPEGSIEEELDREFRGVHSEQTIESVARESVIELADDDVRIMAFVPIIASRAAGSRLRRSGQRAR